MRTRRYVVLLLALMAAGAGCQRGNRRAEVRAGGTDRLPGLWTAVAAEAAAIDSLVAAGRLLEVKPHARTLRETAALLPAVSGAYVSTRQGPLTFALRELAALADTLAEAAGREATLETWQAARRIDRVIASIAGLYPAGALKPAG